MRRRLSTSGNAPPPPKSHPGPWGAGGVPCGLRVGNLIREAVGTPSQPGGMQYAMTPYGGLTPETTANSNSASFAIARVATLASGNDPAKVDSNFLLENYRSTGPIPSGNLPGWAQFDHVLKWTQKANGK